LCFAFFGGTFKKVIYDNDSVLKNNKTNKLTLFCLQMEVHYKFEAIFCNKAAGWEKGAVENAVGFCRRNFLAGLTEFPSIDQLNIFLEEECLKVLAEEKHYISGRPLCEIFDELQNKTSPFNKGKPWGKWEDLKVNEFQQILYQGYNYSVPERYVGFHLRVFITVFTIDIYDGIQLVISHKRRFYEKGDSLLLDHYLDQLLRKPKAVPHAKVIKDQQFPEHILELQNRFLQQLSRKRGRPTIYPKSSPKKESIGRRLSYGNTISVKLQRCQLYGHRIYSWTTPDSASSSY
jgi:hypothetical protein